MRYHYWRRHVDPKRLQNLDDGGEQIGKQQTRPSDAFPNDDEREQGERLHAERRLKARREERGSLRCLIHRYFLIKISMRLIK